MVEETKKRGPGRPRKVVEEPTTEKGVEAQEELKADLLPVKQVIRYIAKDAGAVGEGAWMNDWVEDYLAQYLRTGYELKSAYPFDNNQFGIGMVYVLTLK